MLGRLLLVAAVAATMATAQRGGRGGGLGSGDVPMLRNGAREGRFDRVASRLKLNKHQKAEAQNILDEEQKEALPVLEAMGKARIAAGEAMINNRSAGEIDKALAAYTQAAAQMTGIEEKAFSRIYATLKPNQQPKAGPAFEEMAGIFLWREWRQAR